MVEAAGGPPTPRQITELNGLSAKLSLLSRWDFYLLTLALLFMATARYW